MCNSFPKQQNYLSVILFQYNKLKQITATLGDGVRKENLEATLVSYTLTFSPSIFIGWISRRLIDFWRTCSLPHNVCGGLVWKKWKKLEKEEKCKQSSKEPERRQMSQKFNIQQVSPDTATTPPPFLTNIITFLDINMRKKSLRQHY